MYLLRLSMKRSILRQYYNLKSWLVVQNVMIATCTSNVFLKLFVCYYIEGKLKKGERRFLQVRGGYPSQTKENQRGALSQILLLSKRSHTQKHLRNMWIQAQLKMKSQNFTADNFDSITYVFELKEEKPTENKNNSLSFLQTKVVQRHVFLQYSGTRSVLVKLVLVFQRRIQHHSFVICRGSKT